MNENRLYVNKIFKPVCIISPKYIDCTQNQ